MIARQEQQSTLSVILQLANPVFVVLSICVPIGALVLALTLGSFQFLKYVHVMTGALWTGIDLFMGLVIGPVLGGMEPKDRARVFMRLMPKMTFLMPVVAGVTSTAGIYVAQHLGMFTADNPWIVAALIVTALLTVQGFGILLPNEIRIFKQLLSPTPDIDKISRLGMQNAKLGGIQGLFQLVVIFIMAFLRF